MELENRLKNDRFFVIKEESVMQWIVVSDYIYTWVSTSVVESYFANKQCTIIRPIPIKRKFDIQLFENANIISNKEDLLEMYLNREEGFPVDKDTIEKYYDNDERFTYRRIVDLLVKVIETNDYDINKYPLKLYFLSLKTILVRMIKNLIYNLRITSSSSIIKKIKKISDWLDFFYYYQKKEKGEEVSEKDRILTENKIKRIMERINNE